MHSTGRLSVRALAVAVLAGFGIPAHASLVLDTTVTSSFTPVTTTTNTIGNDFPGLPNTLYFGQLAATAAGHVDFFYVGNEAGYTNTLWVGGSAVHSTASLPDVFDAPYPLVGGVGAGAGQFVDFGFCTSGGVSLATYGRCAENDSAASLIAQFNYGTGGGYRSIGFLPLASFNPVTGAWSAGTIGSPSDLWMVLWDDSGAKNDDNHDDYIAVARFRPIAVTEPGSLALFGMALLVLGLRRRLARR